VSTVDEGIKVLTGLPAGRRGHDGSYSKNSVNALVEKTRWRYSEQQKQFQESGKDGD
jgi:hypothetical protein